MNFVSGQKNVVTFHIVEKVVEDAKAPLKEISPQSLYALIVGAFPYQRWQNNIYIWYHCLTSTVKLGQPFCNWVSALIFLYLLSCFLSLDRVEDATACTTQRQRFLRLCLILLWMAHHSWLLLPRKAEQLCLLYCCSKHASKQEFWKIHRFPHVLLFST